MREVTESWFNDFFSVVNDKGILQRRETETVEFKKEFNWEDKKFKSKISRTAASFSNNSGGIIIFGVDDKPHNVVGIEGFEETDEADISTWFNQHFSPAIRYSKHMFVYEGKQIGLIQIYESKNKPVMCIKDSVETKDSEIYYRYSALSSRIKSGDLIYLINKIKEEISEKWLSTINNIATIGVENTGLLNTNSGELSSNNNKFLLDESILKEINFLNEFSQEKDGAMAVKIIGEVDSATTVIKETKTLFEEDIYLSFLSEDFALEPKEYLSFIIRQNTPMYPIYWFLNTCGIDPKDRYNFIDSIKSHSKNKEKVLERLVDDKKINSKYGNYSLTAKKLGPLRKGFYDHLCSSEDFEVANEVEVKAFLESIFSLKKDDFDLQFVKKQLLLIYNEFYPFEKSGVHPTFRWAITYLDYIYYK